MQNYYPLAVENEWHYRQNNGNVYINKVSSVSGDEFTMHNSAVNTFSKVKKEGNLIKTDALEAGNFQPWLTDNLQKGENWAVMFKTNGLVSMLIMTIKDMGIEKEVEGKVYRNVICVEAENKIIVNDTLMPLNFFTQYYYAENVGLILTTSSAGDIHSLVDYKLY